MVAQERINVRETVGRKNNCKVNFFSMYFVRTKEEIYLSFKNSEKEQTQALSLVLLLLLVNFVSGSRLKLMYISLMENVRSSLTHFHGFQLLVLLP